VKLELTEVYLLKTAVESINIKATDAPVVAKMLDKLDREFNRLQKLEEKKRSSNGVATVA
jgi:hypothetical protein